MLHTTKSCIYPSGPLHLGPKIERRVHLKSLPYLDNGANFAYHGSLRCSRINGSPSVALVHVGVTDRVWQGYIRVTTSGTLASEEGSKS